MRQHDRSRPNLIMALIVDQGIAMAETTGRAAAAAYLAQRKVPDAVIARVLCDPEHRRNSAGPRFAPQPPAVLARQAENDAAQAQKARPASENVSIG
jgi:hypothetical protein